MKGSYRKWLFLAIFPVLLFGAYQATPTWVAYLCPKCLGFSQVDERTHVEAGATDEELALLKNELVAANALVDAFYTERQGKAALLICRTDQCNDRMGGTAAKALTFGNTYMYVAPSGRNMTILAHELAHVEMHKRLGRAFLDGALPAWFDEGLATIISQDERHVAISIGGEAVCLEESSQELPDSAAEWLRQAPLLERPIYAIAACRVIEWMERNGGKDGVLDMAASLNAGEVFFE